MARKLKLKYCPVCGSHVKMDYSNGAIYSLIMWRCTKQRCRMSKEERPLAAWNVANRPNIWTRIMVAINDIRWRYRCRSKKELTQ